MQTVLHTESKCWFVFNNNICVEMSLTPQRGVSRGPHWTGVLKGPLLTYRITQFI